MPTKKQMQGLTTMIYISVVLNYKFSVVTLSVFVNNLKL